MSTAKVTGAFIMAVGHYVGIQMKQKELTKTFRLILTL